MFNANNVILLLNLISKKLKLNDFLSSVLVFGGIPLALGFLLMLPQNDTYVLFEFEILFALSWLAIAPFLIKYGSNAAKQFHLDMIKIFPDSKGQIEEIYQDAIGNALYSKKNLIFGLTLAIAASYLLLICYEMTSNLTKIWLVATFSSLFLISGIGFWAIILIMAMPVNMLSISLHIDAYHPDNMGGLSIVRSFCILGSVLFSTGSLVFPIAFKLFEVVSGESIALYLLASITLIYALLIIISFVIPAIALTKLIQNNRNELLTEIGRKIHQVESDYFKKLDYKIGISLFILNSAYQRVSLMRTHPYNFRVLLELLGSMLFPIVIAITQYYTKFGMK